MSTLQQLKRAGSIALWHDYRLGHALDQSGNDNNGVLINDPISTRNGFHFQYNGNAAVRVENHSSISLTEMSICCLFRYGRVSQDSITCQICRKQDGGGAVAYSLRFLDDSDDIRFDATTGATWNTFSRSIMGLKYVGANVKSGQPATKLHLNGIFADDGIGPTDIDETSTQLFIGNWYSLDRGVGGTISSFLIFNKLLSETEHASIFGELLNE